MIILASECVENGCRFRSDKCKTCDFQFEKYLIIPDEYLTVGYEDDFEDDFEGYYPWL